MVQVSANENFSFPIVIRFRDLNDQLADNKLNRPILSYILRLLNITYSFKDEAILKTTSNSTEKIGYPGYYNSFFLSKMAINFLDELKILLILDGFDELTVNVKQLVLKEISDFSIGFNNSRINNHLSNR